MRVRGHVGAGPPEQSRVSGGEPRPTSFRAATRRPGDHLGVGECARTLIIPGVATPAQLIPGVVGVAPAIRGTGGEKAVEYGLERQRLERLGKPWQDGFVNREAERVRSEEETSELKTLIRISFDGLYLEKKNI